MGEQPAIIEITDGSATCAEPNELIFNPTVGLPNPTIAALVAALESLQSRLGCGCGDMVICHRCREADEKADAAIAPLKEAKNAERIHGEIKP